MGHVELRVDGSSGIAELTNTRRRNAITPEMYEQLEAGIASFEQNPDIVVLILRGAGDHFCSGFDLTTAAGTDNEDVMRGSAELLVRINRRLTCTPLPTIAAIRGAVYGAGLGLAMACDVRVAGASARFCMPVARLGGAYPTELFASVAHAVGLSRAVELFLTGREVDGEDAVRLGLAHHGADDTDLASAAAGLAARVAEGAPASLAYIKEQASVVRRRLRPPVDELDELDDRLIDIVMGEEAQAARRAFLEKKKRDGHDR